MNATLHFQFFLAVMAALAPTWVTDPLEPPLAGMERAVAAR